MSKNIIHPLLKDIAFIEQHLPSTFANRSYAMNFSVDSLLSYFASKPELHQAHLILRKISLLFETSVRFSSLSKSLESFFSAIRELSVGNSLDLYRWSKYVLSQQEKMAYADLLMGLFCSYLDFAVPGEDKVSFSSGPFTRNYFSSSPTDQIKFFGIQRTGSKQPHFDVMRKGTVFECSDGPSNVFMAILVFLSIVRKEFSGYVGLLNLQSQSVDNLLSVLE